MGKCVTNAASTTDWPHLVASSTYAMSGTADFFSVRIFCDCVKRSVASSMALCTTETIQMGSSQRN